MKIEIEIRYPVLPESAEKFEDALREFIVSFFRGNVDGEIYNHLTGNSIAIRSNTGAQCDYCGFEENLIRCPEDGKYYCERCCADFIFVCSGKCQRYEKLKSEIFAKS